MAHKKYGLQDAESGPYTHMTSAPAPVSYNGPSQREPADFGIRWTWRRLTAFWAVEHEIRRTPQRSQCFRFWRISTGRLEPRRATILEERSRGICEPKKPSPPRRCKHSGNIPAVCGFQLAQSRVANGGCIGSGRPTPASWKRRIPRCRNRNLSLNHLPNAVPYW